MSSVQDQPQHSILETVIDNPTIETALENRDKAKRSARAVAKKAKDADDIAKALLGELDMGIDAPIRIGRFVINVREVAGKEVSFETAASTRLTIKADKEPSA